MKLPCEMIQDLLPLYEDEICSEKSKEVVEQHLRECSDCRNQVKKMKIISETEKAQSSKEENRAAAKSFHKIRRKWLLSLIAMLLIAPILCLTINQVRGIGVCYTNVDEIIVAREFIQALEEQDAKKAFAMTNFEESYQQIKNVAEKKIEDDMSEYMSVFIGDEEWMADKEMYESDFQGKESVGEEFWEEGVLAGHLLIVPIDAWNNMVSKYPNNFQVIDEERTSFENEEERIGWFYKRMETEWGTYMVEEFHAVWKAESLADFCRSARLVPIALYQQALSEMQEIAQDAYLKENSYYAEVLQMETAKEYEEMMQKRQSEKLEEQMQAGFTFKNMGYKESVYLTSKYYDRVSERWNIVYGVEVLYQEENYPISIEMEILDGEIVALNMNCNHEYLDSGSLYPLYRALMISYMK